jgi:G3E family GTPase
MIGGFLGAGKTTAVLRLAESLTARGRRVGLITNDQSFGLVDSAMLRSHGLPVEEITGGCFCCRFNSLVDASQRLSAAARPDVFLAEPVGSCTDLKATVDYPLRRMYGDGYSVAPLSVMVDPVRAGRILGLEPGKSFSPKVRYIYGKQLEEADLIVINKIDTLPAGKLTELRAALESRFPRAAVMAVSARAGTGMDEWLAAILDDGRANARTDSAMAVDYDTYAEGEALMGWLNAAAKVAARKAGGFDGNALLLRLAADLRERLGREGAEIAHLKMTLTPDADGGTGGGDIAVANMVRDDSAAELSHRLSEPLAAGEMILNLRAEGDPETLKAAVEAAFDAVGGQGGLRFDLLHLERFRPARPTPTHRLAAV